MLIVVGQESCVWVFFAIGSLCGSSCVSASVCFGVSVVGFQRRYAILHKCGCRAVLHLGAPQNFRVLWRKYLRMYSGIGYGHLLCTSCARTTGSRNNDCFHPSFFSVRVLLELRTVLLNPNSAGMGFWCTPVSVVKRLQFPCFFVADLVGES